MSGVFEDHLAVDAIVAYVDGELSLVAYQRAATHLGRCASCAAEVAEQTSMQQCLRSATLPAMPGSLFDSLRSIPVALPATPSSPVVAGLDRGADGQLRHPVGAGRGRRFRLGAGALVAGLAVGALVTAGADEPAPGPMSPSSSTVQWP